MGHLLKSGWRQINQSYRKDDTHSRYHTYSFTPQQTKYIKLQINQENSENNSIKKRRLKQRTDQEAAVITDEIRKIYRQNKQPIRCRKNPSRRRKVKVFPQNRFRRLKFTQQSRDMIKKHQMNPKTLEKDKILKELQELLQETRKTRNKEKDNIKILYDLAKDPWKDHNQKNYINCVNHVEMRLVP